MIIPESFITTKIKSNTFSLALLVVLGVWWPSLPILKYPFLLLYIYFIGNLVFKLRVNVFSEILNFLWEYKLILLLICLILLGFVSTHEIDVLIIKDLIIAIILITIFFILKISIPGINEFNLFLKYVFELILILSAVLIIYYFIASFIIFPDLNYLQRLLFSDAKNIDYNFALIPVICGLLILFEKKYYNNLSNLRLFLVHTAMFVFSLQILFSGSRRGLMALLIFLLLIIAVQILIVFYKNNFLKRFARISRYFLFLWIFLIPVSLFLFIKSPYYVKNRIIETFGSENLLVTKIKITLQVKKYLFLYKDISDFGSLYNKIWSTEFNPLDPESCWGSRYHKTLFPLPDRHPEIPSDAKGFLIDSTCFNLPFPDVIDYHFPILIKNLQVKENERYKLSIFCFVSEDFSGASVRYQPGWKAIEERTVTEYTIPFYNMDMKGRWQKLEFEILTGTGDVPVYTSINMEKEGLFSSMKGYVILAFPQISKISNIPENSGNVFFDANSPDNDKHVFTSAGCLYFPLGFTLFDNIQKLIKPNIDSSFYDIKIKNEIIESQVLGHRYDRWKFALIIFSKEYNLRQKLFGNGFNYTFWYGKYFLYDSQKSDGPHNPFLSILLYSGVVGLFVYLLFIIKVFYYYLRYIRDYPLLCIFFFITFFFAFFSSGSPFDPPVFGFFSILPFFIHSVHKREEQKTDTSQQ